MDYGIPPSELVIICCRTHWRVIGNEEVASFAAKATAFTWGLCIRNSTDESACGPASGVAYEGVALWGGAGGEWGKAAAMHRNRLWLVPDLHIAGHLGRVELESLTNKVLDLLELIEPALANLALERQQVPSIPSTLNVEFRPVERVHNFDPFVNMEIPGLFLNSRIRCWTLKKGLGRSRN